MFLMVKMVTPKYVLRLWYIVPLLSLVTFTHCQPSYDFIVVGSGAGGSVVARRLVENGKFNVLLIETGGFPRQGYDVPARVPEFFSDPQVTFHVPSQPMENAALAFNGVADILYGKMLGGTTSLNDMWFNRGHPRDWENWADVTGDDSWRYENMLKYFKRSENYEGDFPSDQHGYDGPITVSRPRYSPGLDIWLRAGKEMGYSVGDPNGPQRLGFSPVEFSKRRGRRDGGLTGYIAPVLNMTNFHILTNTNVTQIVFRNKRAIGVRITSDATRSLSPDNFIYATKEVIISAGAYNSPLILQRSGIGPRHVLQPAKIPVIVELPTGENLQEHAGINLNFAVNNASVIFDEEADLTPENLQIFKLVGDGPYSTTRGGTGQALLSSSIARSEGNADWPDIQLIMAHSTLPWYFQDGLAPTANRLLRPGEVPISMVVYLGRPKSRGNVRINPSNILGDPLVDLGLQSDSRDDQILLDGINEALHVYEQTSAYNSHNPRYTPAAVPACDQYDLRRSNEYWRCYIEQVALPGCHPVGSNKMGKSTDPTAVVDPELRVIGTEGLRVVDASIMPFHVNANPQAAVYAIAEKGAESILRRWQSPELELGELEKNRLVISIFLNLIQIQRFCDFPRIVNK